MISTAKKFPLYLALIALSLYVAFSIVAIQELSRTNDRMKKTIVRIAEDSFMTGCIVVLRATDMLDQVNIEACAFHAKNYAKEIPQ